MNIAPNISIIIATFNAAKTFRKALDSVRYQTYQDWECIIVDGVSTDDTVSIACEYVEKDQRFRLISEPDKGIYDAFNKGWKLAKGEWIYYLGADDVLLPNGMAEIFSKEWPQDVVYGNVYFKTPRGIIKKKSNLDPDSIRTQMPSHQAVFMRRYLIEELGGFDLQYKICGDFDLILRGYMRNCMCAYCDANIAVFTAIDGASSINLNNVFEGYRIRKRAGSVSQFTNIKKTIINICRKALRIALRRMYMILKCQIFN